MSLEKVSRLTLQIGIVLGITSNTDRRSAGVPTAVYASIVAVQSLGFFFSFFIRSPESIRRDDGQAIADFKPLTWKEEVSAMRGSFLKPETLLLAIALFASQMPFTLMGAMNGFFFSARTRALANVRLSQPLHPRAGLIISLAVLFFFKSHRYNSSCGCL